MLIRRDCAVFGQSLGAVFKRVRHQAIEVWPTPALKLEWCQS